MFRPGARPYGGPTKATAETTCQKCLKKGHYSYECTVTTAQRPYKSRPSRTQQLLNPKLAPQLTNDAPNILECRKGIADEQLARVANEREAKRRRTVNDGYDSESSASSSVATISTNQSRSASPPPSRQNKRTQGRKRSPSSSPSESSDSGHSDASIAPESRKKSRRSLWRRSRSPAKQQGQGSRSRSPYRDFDRKPRRRSSGQEPAGQQRSYFETEESSSKRPARDAHDERQRSEGKRRLRSLSPFSKRLALTQAMNA